MTSSSRSSNFKLLTAESHTELPSFDEAVLAGLGQPPGERRIPCRFLYDEKGSQLFEEICELPEYYPTQAEISILEQNAAEIVESLEPGAPLVELGSGSERKIRPILEAVLEQQGEAHYIPIDISPTILEENAEQLLDEFGSSLRVTAIAGEYRDALQALQALEEEKPLGLWMGGSVGNMKREEAKSFLGRVREQLPEIVVGIDLRKDPSVLLPAYDDSQGVTAEFSLNVLDRISNELDADFEKESFRHVVHYDSDAGRVGIEIESQKDQKVRIDQLDLDIEFSEGERVHIEDSIKYSRQEIEALAAGANYQLTHQWLDDGRRFSVNRFGPQPN